VNWYGGASKDYVVGGLHVATIDSIAQLTRQYGFNCVRIPWSLGLYEHNPVITNTTILAANLNLVGMRALDILDKVVNALAAQGLFVILDNHMSDPDWCCSNDDRNGLWYNTRYPYENWINDWKGLVARYVKQPAVVAVDLRNELRTSCDFPDGCRTPVWGGGNPNIDWHLAAQNAGNAIHSVNPTLLIIVEGLSYSANQKGVYNLPLTLNIPNRVVYEAHDYSFFHNPQVKSYDELRTVLGDNWGFILTQGKNFTAPVWVGEFGTCHNDPSCLSGPPGTGGFWFQSFITYLNQSDIDWSWWALDGTESTGTGRVWGREETYGVLNMAWNAPASEPLLKILQSIQKPTQGPGVK